LKALRYQADLFSKVKMYLPKKNPTIQKLSLILVFNSLKNLLLRFGPFLLFVHTSGFLFVELTKRKSTMIGRGEISKGIE